MKITKRFFSMLLALLMLASLMAVPALADDPITITIQNAMPDHAYEAYQVFSGTLSADGVLSDVEWGEGVNGEGLLAALKDKDSVLFVKDGVNQFAAATDAEGVAKVLGGWSYNESNIKNFADLVGQHLTTTCHTSDEQDGDEYVITVPAVGYYFVKDAETLTGADAATDYLLQVVKSVEVAPKVSSPTFLKTVNSEVNGTYQHAIDAQIGDTVYFKLETKLPSLYNDYKQYLMIMEDVLPQGLEFNQVEDIYIHHASGGQTSYLNTTNPVYHQRKDSDTVLTKWFAYDAGTLTVNFGNLRASQQKPNLNDTFVVKYSATVTNAVVYGKNGELGNVNSATLQFSNDMNQDAPEDATQAAAISMGVLSDSANVYVYQLQVTKQDTLTKAPLAGAQFYLFRNMVVKNDADEEETVRYYAHTDANGVITGWSTETPKNPMVSGEDGVFVIKGLDSLAYHLEEVKAPDGYNKMENTVLVTLTATIDTHTLTALECTADSTKVIGTVNDGLVAIAVNNTAGTTLPETGGMGTTIFYVVGGILLLAVAVILITKKRREA